jgi:hypothetical protein
MESWLIEERWPLQWQKGAARVPIYEAIGRWAACWTEGLEDPAACQTHAVFAHRTRSVALR